MHWFKKFSILSFVLVSLSLFLFFLNNNTSLKIPKNQPNEKKVFDSENIGSPKQKSEKLKTTIILGGDVMLGRNVMLTSKKYNNYLYPFEKISEFTSQSDIFFVNLENPIIKDCPDHIGGFTFCAPPDAIDGLKAAGINVVTLANNHSGNWGISGINETESYLEKKEILATGRGKLVKKSINDLTLGFLGFDFTVKKPSEEDYDLVTKSNDDVDFLIIGIHWGEEYKDTGNNNQKNWAREMVKMGGDIIVGHHPHWVQDFECLDPSGDVSETTGVCDAVTGKPVYYSLGNLVFDQMWSEETKKGMIVKIEIGKSGITNEERYNTYIKSIGQPEVVGENVNK